MLRVDDVTVCYGKPGKKARHGAGQEARSWQAVVDHLSFSLEAGQWLMLVGPNGAGKSTLIRAIAQGVPYTGSIALEGKDISAYKPAQLAQKVGVLAQQHSVGYGYSVEEVVSLGRYAHASGFLAGRDAQGAARIDEALALTGLSALRHASVLTLSGGELQRTFLAQVFAQDPQLLILDEPANHLDLVYQKHIFSLIGDWLKTPGRAVISVVHDLSLAKRYGTHAVLMNRGRCVARGTIDKALTRENLCEVYDMDVYGFMQEMLEQWQDAGDQNAGNKDADDKDAVNAAARV